MIHILRKGVVNPKHILNAAQAAQDHPQPGLRGPARGPAHCTQLRPVSNTAVPNWMRSVPAYPATKVNVYGTLDDPEFARRTLTMNTTLLSLYLHMPGYLPLLTVPEMNRRLQYMQAEPSAALDEAFDRASCQGGLRGL